jgi:hypothetical protein
MSLKTFFWVTLVVASLCVNVRIYNTGMYSGNPQYDSHTITLPFAMELDICHSFHRYDWNPMTGSKRIDVDGFELYLDYMENTYSYAGLKRIKLWDSLKENDGE